MENIIVNGYGKTSTDALISGIQSILLKGINNIIDSLIEEEEFADIMKHCIKKLNFEHYAYNQNNTNSQHNQTNHNHESSKKQLLSTEKAMKT